MKMRITSKEVVGKYPELTGILTEEQDEALYNILVNAINHKNIQSKIDTILWYSRAQNYNYGKIKMFKKLMKQMNYGYVLINRLLRTYKIKDEFDNLNFNGYNIKYDNQRNE